MCHNKQQLCNAEHPHTPMIQYYHPHETIPFSTNKIPTPYPEIFEMFSALNYPDNTRNSCTRMYEIMEKHTLPDIKVHGANKGPTWVLSAPDRPHVCPVWAPWTLLPGLTYATREHIQQQTVQLAVFISSLPTHYMYITQRASVEKYNKTKRIYTTRSFHKRNTYIIHWWEPMSFCQNCSTPWFLGKWRPFQNGSCQVDFWIQYREYFHRKVYWDVFRRIWYSNDSVPSGLINY